MAGPARRVTVRSWAELQDRLYEGTWQAGLRRFRSNFAYRGMADAAAPLTSGLARLGGRYQKLEYHLLRNFKKYAQFDIGRCVDSDWQWIALAQHHGLPTRLMDWTFSPLVALHFATANLQEINRTSAILCLDFVEAHRRLPGRLKEALAREGSNVFTVEMLARVAPTLREFDTLSEEPFLAFFEPPSLDTRIVNQFALFSLLSGPELSLRAWLQRHPRLWRQIVIPRRLNWEIRDKLDQANITERMLFPGLDGLATWLTRHYGPKRSWTRARGESPRPDAGHRQTPRP